jgi:hypothetical protein
VVSSGQLELLGGDALLGIRDSGRRTNALEIDGHR